VGNRKIDFANERDPAKAQFVAETLGVGMLEQPGPEVAMDFNGSADYLAGEIGIESIIEFLFSSPSSSFSCTSLCLCVSVLIIFISSAARLHKAE
jgi:hypothetical protein